MIISSDDNECSTKGNQQGQNSGEESKRPSVEIFSGTVHGKLVKSPQGTDVEQYLGIPFAKPPIGDLRFANPVPLSKFDGGIKPLLEMFA